VDVRLSQDVKDIRGRVLVPADTDVLQWAQTYLFSSEYLKKKTRFKDAPAFADDCQKIFELKPYDQVLSGWTEDFRSWMGEIYAPSIVFDELRLIKTTDPYTYQHILVIAVVGARLLEIWIQSAATVKSSFQALICHRLGKARLAQMLLQKEGDLDESEKRAIFEQPLVGFVLNACYWGSANHLCAKLALQHQEDRAGKGYPYGVKTKSLVLDVLHLLDRFDALIQKRPFRYKNFSTREALDLVHQEVKEGRMEEDVLKAFTDLLRAKKLKDYKKLKLGTIGRPSQIDKERSEKKKID